MKSIFVFIFALFAQASWAQINLKEQQALIALQKFVNELTAHQNAVILEGKPKNFHNFEKQLAKLAYPAFLAHLQKDTQALLTKAQTAPKDFRQAQIALSENIYLAYLKAHETKMLENAYHHAEAEMTHALSTLRNNLRLCDSLQNTENQSITTQNGTAFSVRAGKAYTDFWDTWQKAKTNLANATYQQKLHFYNETLIKAFQNFIDEASQEGIFLPYQPYLPHCPKSEQEAGAEGR